VTELALDAPRATGLNISSYDWLGRGIG
jgi:hypothetical protein